MPYSDPYAAVLGLDSTAILRTDCPRRYGGGRNHFLDFGLAKCADGRLRSLHGFGGEGFRFVHPKCDHTFVLDDGIQAMEFLATLNNREVAALFWLGVVLIFMLAQRDLRAPLGGVAAAALQPAIVVSTAALASYSAGVALLASHLGLWEPDLMKETVIWFAGIGLGLLMSVGHVSERDGWFRQEAAKAIRITIFVEFFVNLAVLGLPLELLLAPFLALLAMMSALAEGREDLRPAKSLTDGLLGLVGFALFTYVGVKLVTDWESFNNRHTLQSLALPLWLTLGALPFIYAVGVWSSYQSAFARIDGATSSRRARVRAKLTLLAGLHLRARELGEFRVYEATTVANAISVQEARQGVRSFRAGLEDERRALQEEEDRLRRYAGVDGVDEQGRQLDRREFAETREALQYLAMAQSGWYTNPEKRYRDDLLGVLEPFSGLPAEHGISMTVAPDGQSWWAWRRTITGWCFAIGSSAPPPDEWLHDGPEPPTGFPGEDPAWGERWGVGAKNWTDPCHAEAELTAAGSTSL
jgi:hypothetical protein